MPSVPAQKANRVLERATGDAHAHRADADAAAVEEFSANRNSRVLCLPGDWQPAAVFQKQFCGVAGAHAELVHRRTNGESVCRRQSQTR